jgi:acetyl esterase/lipase
MAYVVALVSAFLVFSAATALRPGRRGVFAALAFPVGWAAGELPIQALVVEGALVGLLRWWGWPRSAWLSDVVTVLAALAVAENLALVGIVMGSRRVVRRALASSPRRPLDLPRPRDDQFGSWWRTALQFSFHPRYMQLVRNVEYGPERRHRLDVWRTSTTPRNAPVVFYIHGGAWTFGDKREQGRPMLHEFVARGWVVVTCNYRLAPRHPWPAQIEDVVRTLAWIKRNVADYGGDPDRVVVSGLSAGGHLAALVALAPDDAAWCPPDLRDVADWSVRGCVPFSGVLEMTGDESHWRGLGRGLRHLLEHRVVQRPYEGNEELYRSLSPHHRLHEDAPPFLVIQGVNDTLVDVQVARDFVTRSREVAFAPIYYVELPFAQHSFDVTASPRTSATTRAAVAFAESVTQPRPLLTPERVASYRVPPTELLVRVDAGWVDAREIAGNRGPFFVVTSDNPFSECLDTDENQSRRADLVDLVARRGVSTLATLARDPSGRWPDEEGVALADVAVGFARRLAHVFDQFAFYEVTADAVGVRDAHDGRLLT